MKILITGGAGFIGSHFVDRLIKESHNVFVVDNLSIGKKEYLNPKAKFYRIDIQSPKIEEIFKKEKPEIVFHMAAQINVRFSVENPIEDAKNNILGSINILENSKKYKVKKFIFISTGGAIYGDADIIPTSETYSEKPLSPYGIAKLSVEKYLYYYWKMHNLKFVILRLANVYGSRQNSTGEAGVIAIFCDKMLSKKQPIINGDGKQTRDFVYVDDVVEAGRLAMKKNVVGIYNIGTAKETNINTIFRKLRNLINPKIKEKHISAKAGEQKRSCLDFQKAKKELNWEPKVDLDRGLLLTLTNRPAGSVRVI